MVIDTSGIVPRVPSVSTSKTTGWIRVRMVPYTPHRTDIRTDALCDKSEGPTAATNQTRA